MTLEERVARNSAEDQIEIGEIIEKATRGSFGVVLRLIINGMIDVQLDSSRRGNGTSAERVLGRIESLNDLMQQLDTCIEQKNDLTEELKEQKEI